MTDDDRNRPAQQEADYPPGGHPPRAGGPGAAYIREQREPGEAHQYEEFSAQSTPSATRPEHREAAGPRPPSDARRDPQDLESDKHSDQPGRGQDDMNA